MARPIQVMEVHRRMDRSEEGTVQPTTTLRDQFGDLVWYIGHGVGGLDVVQDPGAAAFRDKLPAEDLPNTRGLGIWKRDRVYMGLTRSSARYMLAVKISAPAPCLRSEKWLGNDFFGRCE